MMSVSSFQKTRSLNVLCFLTLSLCTRSERSHSWQLRVPMAKPTDVVFVAGAIATCVAVTVGMVGPVTGGGKSLSSAFTWHPILMSVAFPCLMMLGRWAYVSDEIGDKEQQRSLHRIFMMLASLIAVGGYVAIFMAHLPLHTFFGYNFSTHKWAVPTRVAHDILGYGILILTLAQSSMGLCKLASLREGRGIFKFHGTLGKAIMVLSSVNIVLACVFWSWSTGYKILVALLTVTVSGFAAFSPLRRAEESEPIVKSTERA